MPRQHRDGWRSTQEVAELFGVSSTTIHRWVKNGFAPPPGAAKWGRRTEASYSPTWVAEVRKRLADG